MIRWLHWKLFNQLYEKVFFLNLFEIFVDLRHFSIFFSFFLFESTQFQAMIYTICRCHRVLFPQERRWSRSGRGPRILLDFASIHFLSRFVLFHFSSFVYIPASSVNWVDKVSWVLDKSAELWLSAASFVLWSLNINKSEVTDFNIFRLVPNDDSKYKVKES